MPNVVISELFIFHMLCWILFSWYKQDLDKNVVYFKKTINENLSKVTPQSQYSASGQIVGYRRAFLGFRKINGQGISLILTA